jgi:hypothetical protein
LFLSPEAAELPRRCALEDIPAQLPARDEPKAEVSPEFDLNPLKVLGEAQGRPFLISQLGQADIVRWLAWQSVAFIWGGLVTTLSSLGYLGQRLGWW